MTPVSEPLPLGEHRARVLKYLRGMKLPFTSVAGAIIEERLPADDEHDLLRPSLVLLACAACGGDGADALPIAAAFDLFDRFMLLHDELVETLPGPSVARWGLGQSLNAGDALYALAFRCLAIDVTDAQRRLDVAALVGRAVLEAIEGRNIDIGLTARGEGDGLFARMRSLRRRSAALTGAALASGALVAGAPERVVRGFARAGRLLDVAGAIDDAALADRVAAKAREAIERCLPDHRHFDAFEEVVRYVAARAA